MNEKPRLIVLGPPGDVRTHKITPTGASEIPRTKELDFQTFETKADRIRQWYERLRDWLTVPYTEDTFEKHADRRAWEEKLTMPKYDVDMRIHTNTKLSNNKIGIALSTLKGSEKLFSGLSDSSLKQKIDEILSSPPTINQLFDRAYLQEDDPKARTELAKHVEEKVKRVLHAVAKRASHTDGTR